MRFHLTILALLAVAYNFLGASADCKPIRQFFFVELKQITISNIPGGEALDASSLDKRAEADCAF